MNRTLRTTTSRILGSLVFGTALLATTVADAAPPVAGDNDEAATLVSKLGDVLGKPGGLTSDTVATRAAATSFDVKSKRDDIEAAAAQVDQALVGYFPKLGLTARYTRLSPIAVPGLGNLVLAPQPGGLPGQPPVDTTNLIAQPFQFPVLLNQTLLQASLNVPLSDYLLRIPQAYAAATKNEKAAKLSEGAARLKAASDARVVYYTWVRAKLQEIVAGQAYKQANAHLVDARHGFDAGTLSKADVLRIESQAASSLLLVERAKSLAEVTETQIRVAMHDPAPGSYEVGETVVGEQPTVERGRRGAPRDQSAPDDVRGPARAGQSCPRWQLAAPRCIRRRHLRQPQPAHLPATKRFQGDVGRRCAAHLLSK